MSIDHQNINILFGERTEHGYRNTRVATQSDATHRQLGNVH